MNSQVGCWADQVGRVQQRAVAPSDRISCWTASPCCLKSLGTVQLSPPPLTQAKPVVGLLLQRAGGEGRGRLPLLLPGAGGLNFKLSRGHALGNGGRLLLVQVARLGRRSAIHLSDAGLCKESETGSGAHQL